MGTRKGGVETENGRVERGLAPNQSNKPLVVCVLSRGPGDPCLNGGEGALF